MQLPILPNATTFLSLHTPPSTSHRSTDTAITSNLKFSVVVPTLNEADNIDPLLTRVFALDVARDDYEVIIVDDGSADGTPQKVREWEGRGHVRLIERREKPDLTGSILAGAAIARGEVIVVMDADLSHPPERLPALVAPVLEGS
jgi:dolichol-phosphate mannosyltransferase